MLLLWSLPLFGPKLDYGTHVTYSALRRDDGIDVLRGDIVFIMGIGPAPPWETRLALGPLLFRADADYYVRATQPMVVVTFTPNDTLSFDAVFWAGNAQSIFDVWPNRTTIIFSRVEINSTSCFECTQHRASFSVGDEVYYTLYAVPTTKSSVLVIDPTETESASLSPAYNAMRGNLNNGIVAVQVVPPVDWPPGIIMPTHVLSPPFLTISILLSLLTTIAVLVGLVRRSHFPKNTP
jgi:hypothetical protein